MSDVEKKTIKIGSGDIEKYVMPSNARDLRNKPILKIVSDLENMHKEGKTLYLEGNVVVNLKDGEKMMHVLDGNHRIEAARRFFKDHAEPKIFVNLQVHKNLNSEDEKAVFIKTNAVSTQSKTDRIKILNTDSYIFRKLIVEKNNFPVSVSLTGTVRFVNVIEPILTMDIKNIDGKFGDGLYQQIAEMDESHYQKAKEMFDVFSDVFGQPSSNNEKMYAKRFLMAFAKFYKDVKTKYGKEEIRNILEKRLTPIAKRLHLIIAENQASRYGGYEMYWMLCEEFNFRNRDKIEPSIPKPVKQQYPFEAEEE